MRAPCVGIGRLVQREHGGQDRADARIDQVDLGEIPARVAQADLLEVAVSAGDLEAHAVQREGAVGSALAAMLADTEGPAQGQRLGTGARDVGTGQVALQRRRLEFGVFLVVVFLLDPGLRGEVQLLQGEVRLTFEHGHQPGLELSPEAFLLGILVWAVGQGSLVQDAQTGQPLDELVGHHGCAVIGHDGPRQPSLHDRLRDAVHQRGSGLVEEPLQVADQPRMVVHNAEQQRLVPLPIGGEHLARTMVEVQVPERGHVVDLVATHLACLAASRSSDGPIRARARGWLAHQTLRLQIPAHRGVGRQRVRAILGRDAQVVVMQLHGPAGVLTVLLDQRFDDGWAQTDEVAAIVAQSVLELIDRILDVTGPVIPAFDGRRAELNVGAGDGVPPDLGGQCLERLLQFSFGRRRSQQRANDREAQARPSVAMINR